MTSRTYQKTMTKLTNRIVERTRPAAKDKYLSDGDGLFLRVGSNGTKAFVFRYTSSDKRRLLTLGPHPLTTLETARERATEARKLIFAGLDPIEESRRAKQPEPNGETVATLIKDWTERYARKTYKRLDIQLAMVNRDILPVIGTVPVKDVTKRHISKMIGAVVERGARVKANRLLSLTKVIFEFAAQHGYIEASPVVLKQKMAGGREKPKNRVLTPAEIKTFWTVIRDREGFMTHRTRSILRLILLTAQRPGECASAEWDHIDLDARVWSLPPEVTKAERAHVVHLSNEAIEILKAAREHSAGKRYVFPSDRANGNPTGTQTLSMALLRLHKDGEFGGMKSFTPHDLRRTAATRMADIGTHAHIVEKLLNHKMKGVMAVYNYAEYLPERKQALVDWGKQVALYVGQEVDGIDAQNN